MSVCLVGLGSNRIESCRRRSCKMREYRELAVTKSVGGKKIMIEKAKKVKLFICIVGKPLGVVER